jgi:Ca-activated chloride channel family protein
MSNRGILLIGFFTAAFFSLHAQNERKVIRQGLKSYEKGDYAEAEVQFRMAQDINHESFEAEFNTGAALYGQEKYEETVKQYEALVDKAEDPESMAQIWHNIGNSLLEAQQFAPSIEAYKNSLRLNPGDQDTKYNLAYAKQKLQDQDQQQQNQEQQDQDQQQQNQEQQDQDQQQQNQEQQDQDQQQQNQDQRDQDREQQQAQPQQISKDDAQRMLNAIQQQEKDVKDKVDKKKAAVAKVKTEKDW